MDLSEVPVRATARHPWEVVRAEFFERVLLRRLPGTSRTRVLDVGSGDGWFAERVARRHPERIHMTCWDVAYSDAQLGDDAAGTVRRVRDRPSGRFDAVLALDVIEHVEDDAAFLAGIVDLIEPHGGLLVASVPAWQWLFSVHDRQLGHFRRYSPGDFRSLLRSGGLRIDASGNLFHSLFAVRAVSTFARSLAGRSEPAERFELTWDHGAVATALVTGALRTDTLVGRTGLGVPGLSTWAACRR